MTRSSWGKQRLCRQRRRVNFQTRSIGFNSGCTPAKTPRRCVWRGSLAKACAAGRGGKRHCPESAPFAAELPDWPDRTDGGNQRRSPLRIAPSRVGTGTSRPASARRQSSRRSDEWGGAVERDRGSPAAPTFGSVSHTAESGPHPETRGQRLRRRRAGAVFFTAACWARSACAISGEVSGGEIQTDGTDAGTAALPASRRTPVPHAPTAACHPTDEPPVRGAAAAAAERR